MVSGTCRWSMVCVIHEWVNRMKEGRNHQGNLPASLFSPQTAVITTISWLCPISDLPETASFHISLIVVKQTVVKETTTTHATTRERGSFAFMFLSRHQIEFILSSSTFWRGWFSLIGGLLFPSCLTNSLHILQVDRLEQDFICSLSALFVSWQRYGWALRGEGSSNFGLSGGRRCWGNTKMFSSSLKRAKISGFAPIRIPFLACSLAHQGVLHTGCTSTCRGTAWQLLPSPGKLKWIGLSYK